MLSQEYRGSQARVTITLRNVGAADMVGLRTSLGVAPPEALRTQLSKIPQMLGAGGSSQLQLMVECMQCYQEPPTLALDFAVGGRPFHYDLPLPCMCFKFIEQTAMGESPTSTNAWSGMKLRPLSLSGEPDFNNSWNKMNAPGLEQSVVFTCAKPIGPTLVADTLAALNLTPVPGVSPASAAGVLRTGAPTARSRSPRCLGDEAEPPPLSPPRRHADREPERQDLGRLPRARRGEPAGARARARAAGPSRGFARRAPHTRRPPSAPAARARRPRPSA